MQSHPTPLVRICRVSCVAVASLAISAAGLTAATRATAAASTQLSAKGTGKLTVTGGLVAFGQIDGVGTIIIQDDAGGAKVTIGRKARTLPKGTTQIDAVSGKIYVGGNRVTLTVIAPGGLNLSLAGSLGRTLFEGTGTYKLNGAADQSWTVGTLDLTVPAALTKRSGGSSSGKTPSTPTTSTPTASTSGGATQPSGK